MKRDNPGTVEDLYGDLLTLPHYEPKNHTRMDLHKRAAQFAPFAALTGYGDAVKEAARYTDHGIDLSEDEADQMDRKLQILMSAPEEEAEVRILYFKADGKKEGGAFLEVNGRLKKIDGLKRELVLEDGSRIPIRDIINMDGMIFDRQEEGQAL